MQRNTARKFATRSEPLLPYGQQDAIRSRRRQGVCSLPRAVGAVFVAALLGVVTVAFLGVPGYVEPGFSRTKKAAPVQQTNDADAAAHAALWHEYDGEDVEERAEEAVLDQQIRMEQERLGKERLAAEHAAGIGTHVAGKLKQRTDEDRAVAANAEKIAALAKAHEEAQLIASIAELQKHILSPNPQQKQPPAVAEQVLPLQHQQQQQQQQQQHQAADQQAQQAKNNEVASPAPTEAAHSEKQAAAVNPELVSKDAVVQPVVATGIYALKVRNELEQEVSLSKYAGKVTIVVNVASQCGYTTANYEGLVRLYDLYKDRCFEVMLTDADLLAQLAFPCNQFGNQEPGSCTEIQHFAAEKFRATFPIFNKIDVNGPESHPVFKFLKDHTPLGHGGGADVEWNFAKWVVNKKGYPVVRYPSTFDAGTEEALKGWLDYELSH